MEFVDQDNAFNGVVVVEAVEGRMEDRNQTKMSKKYLPRIFVTMLDRNMRLYLKGFIKAR